MKLSITNYEKCEDKTVTVQRQFVPNYTGPQYLTVHSNLKTGSLVGDLTTISLQPETPQEAAGLALHYLKQYERLLLDPEAVAKGAADEAVRLQEAAEEAERKAEQEAEERRDARYRAMSLSELMHRFEIVALVKSGSDDTSELVTLHEILGEKFKEALEEETPIPDELLRRITGARSPGASKREVCALDSKGEWFVIQLSKTNEPA